MERRNLHACLALMFVASALVSFTSSSSRRHFNATVVDPRGNRPVVPGTRSEKCASQKEWPFCLDDDWGHKCPSGCRIQGLIDRDDHENLKRIEKIRDLLDQNNAKHRSTDLDTDRLAAGFLQPVSDPASPTSACFVCCRSTSWTPIRLRASSLWGRCT
uniref:Fibrinogen alpha/beta/gamma chain coiled coil domain-containing protein n=1 Tax=Echeneis naucrates TaxID=173247 RepID=A0A665TNC8_ECHNA